MLLSTRAPQYGGRDLAHPIPSHPIQVHQVPTQELLQFVTFRVGILMMKDVRSMQGFGAVVIDEVRERTLDRDLAMMSTKVADEEAGPSHSAPLCMHRSGIG